MNLRERREIFIRPGLLIGGALHGRGVGTRGESCGGERETKDERIAAEACQSGVTLGSSPPNMAAEAADDARVAAQACRNWERAHDPAAMLGSGPQV